jgi:hypothetical protein
MPLFENAARLIRANLEQFKPDAKIHVKAVAIGTLTDAQLATINAGRNQEGLKPIVSEFLFVGAHIYKSRILHDGYSIADVIDQIESAMRGEAVKVIKSSHKRKRANLAVDPFSKSSDSPG